jgi:outer membrane receptor protein involved in Fe transport
MALNRAFGSGRGLAASRRALTSSAALAFAALVATPAAGQDSTAPDASGAAATIPQEADQTIVVTGSRIKRNGFEEQSPATVISAQRIENLGQVNVGEVLTSIPQNASFQSDTNGGPSVGSRASSNIGATYANLRGLNPFYGTRTLTLVNSRRFVPTSDSGSVDVSLIPSAMISRVETVTGGASAAYGSDAIAGVVNIILDTKFKGVKAQLDYGLTERGDGGSVHGSLAAGTSFAGGRGHVVVSGEYQRNEAIGDCSDVRDWCAESWDVYSNAGILVNGVASGYNVPGSPTYGQPNFVLGPNSKGAYNVANGVIRNAAPAPAALRNRQFDDAGTALLPFDPGMYVQASQIGPRSGGDGESTYADSALRTPIERFALYGNGSYDLTDDITASFEASYGERKATATGVALGPRASLVFRSDNAYLSPALRAMLAGSTGFTLGKDLDEQFANINSARARTFRTVAGLTGKLGIGNWTWDAYYQFGRNSRHQSISHSRVNSFFDFATDAVIDPATNRPACRAVLQGNAAAAGCVPINLFGADNLTPEGIAYAWRPAIEDFKYTQHVVAGSVQGDLFAGIGAGPFAAAAGGEYRADKGDVTHGNVPYYDQFALSLGLDYSGRIKVVEGFVELNAPLLRDLPFADLLELNGAARYTETKSTDGISGASKSVGTTSWKVGAVYQPLDWLRFRGTRSRDIRAAGLRELFQRQIATDPLTAQGRVNNPFNGNVSDNTPILGGGSFALTPEKADTTTVGAVLSPSRKLRLSVDWYQIKLTDAVTTPSGQQLVDNCFSAQAFCDRITFNPGLSGNRDVTYVDARLINLGSFTSRGIDIEGDYTIEMADLIAASNSRLNLRVLGTYLYDMLIQAVPGTPPVNFAGQSGPSAPLGDFNPSPKWIVSSTLTLDAGPFTGTLQARYVGKGALNKTLIGPDDPRYSPTLINSISHNRVPSRTYFTLGFVYRVESGSSRARMELFGNVENLLDKDPPIAPGTTGSVVQSSYPTNPAFFDTLGRRYRMGVRVKY